MEILDRFEADTTWEAAIIVGAGRIFSGGAEFKEFSKPPIVPNGVG